jgi:glycosyltransferase involved in cell wall biosynthesis
MESGPILMLTPEPPYPLHGGGAFRIASLVHYFARFAPVDLVLFAASGNAAVLPPGLVRSQTVIPLPFSDTARRARYLRNARRAIQGVPPLIDRFSGHPGEVARALAGKRYQIGIVEHFWCAPYLPEVAAACGRTVLDLHNIESVLHERCAVTDRGLIAVGHRRFAECSRKLEQKLLPGYSTVLTASETDAALARQIAPGASVSVFPNSLPETPLPKTQEQPVVVFSGNFEYHPNIDAVEFITKSIWPEVHSSCPELRLRLVGRGDRHIRHLLPSGMSIEVTGPVENALAEIAAARIVIAPLRTGSGTRIKILEAWSAGRPVVATSLAAEGLEYKENCDLIVVNGGSAIAAAIAVLNADPERRALIGARGRCMFEERYTWRAAWRRLNDILPVLSGGTERHPYTESSDANRG